MPSLDVALLTARSEAKTQGEALVALWRLHQAGTIDDATYRGTLPVLMQGNIDWLRKYGELQFQHNDLEFVQRAWDLAIGEMVAGRDASGFIDLLDDRLGDLP